MDTAHAAEDRIPDRIDGRTARAERTRMALADAVITLHEEGELRPTAQAVAERAGVSVRAVFHHFQDMEALYAAVGKRQYARNISRVKPDLLTEGPLKKRLQVFVQRRTSLLERMTPVRRAALLNEPFSEQTARDLTAMRSYKRKEMEAAFAAELGEMCSEDRNRLLEALVAASGWFAWESLRAHQGLSVARAREVFHFTLLRLLRSALLWLRTARAVLP